MAWDRDGNMICEEDVKQIYDAALKSCGEWADYSGNCGEITVSFVGTSDEY